MLDESRRKERREEKGR